MTTADMIHPSVHGELIRLAKLDRGWVQIEVLEDGSYAARPKYRTELLKLVRSGADMFSFWAFSVWLADGPKIFRPTPEQCDALEQIAVNVELADYAQPYPALAVELPKGRYGTFRSVICHHAQDGMLSCVTITESNRDDIVTTIHRDGHPIEQSLQTYDDSIDNELGRLCGRALRVAVNSCLALVNFGCHFDYLLKKEAERDRGLAGENSERGERARKRLALHLLEVSFDRTVVLHRTEGRIRAEPGTPTGREVAPHWRRGHWHTVAHGVGKAERKRVLYPPTLVRKDKMLGDETVTSTTYRG